MTEVFLNKSILPKGQESIDLNSKYLQFSFAIVDNPFYVKKGDPIVELSEKEKLFNCRVIAPYDCVIDRSHLFIYSRGIRTSQSIKEGDLFYKVKDSTMGIMGLVAVLGIAYVYCKNEMV